MLTDYSNLISQLLLAGAIYGGIRADLKHLQSQVERLRNDVDYLTRK